MNTCIPKLRSSLLFAAVLALPCQSALAGLVSTEQVASRSEVRADREKVRAFLSRSEAERDLVALGVGPELAKQRVDALTDEEVVSLAGKIDTLPAGGALSNSELIVILLVAILVAILL